METNQSLEENDIFELDQLSSFLVSQSANALSRFITTSVMLAAFDRYLPVVFEHAFVDRAEASGAYAAFDGEVVGGGGEVVEAALHMQHRMLNMATKPPTEPVMQNANHPLLVFEKIGTDSGTGGCDAGCDGGAGGD
ncbi:hypothetical protein M5K25_018963 [Dendrobium thyrsiflorum]|uniref:Uncharacterized protein n=1 Tax=Dendrobium thyrsiflorum TaxID=117978 RepID=A0ABD0UKL5_DENTH